MFVLRSIALAVVCAGLALGSVGCSSSESSPEAQPTAQQPDGGDGGPSDSAADVAIDVATEGSMDASQDAAIEASIEATLPEASADADKSAKFAPESEFGTELTVGFGRIDGTVLAVVGTKDKQCPLSNNDHVVVEVLMHGKVYRMVVSVLSTYGDPDVGMLEKDAPLAGNAWSEGWHTDAVLDYVTTLGVHTGEFTPHPMAELEPLIESKLDIDAKISVFATNDSAQYLDSAHLIHRNKTDKDGAIVLAPDSPSPKYLLFRFANQSF